MDLELAGKVAIVGGGSQGLGRGTAEVLARQGVKLALYALPGDDLDQAARELSQITGEEVLTIPCDIREAADCRRVVAATTERFGGVDLMLTNMAGSYGTPFPTDDEPWSDAWELWARGPMRLIDAAVPVMRERGGGSIVNLTSCGVHQLIEETSFSEIPRLALTGWAKYRATALAPENIRINNMLPGWVMTPRARERLERESEERGVEAAEIEREESAPIPMGRFATAEEIGNSIAFLLSPIASYITGINLRVDGGWCISPTA